jgi:hypothetical protein
VKNESNVYSSAIELSDASLPELESTLRTLRSIKIAQKRAGKKGVQSVISKNIQTIRVEIPVGTDKIFAIHFAEKVTGKSGQSISVIENPRMTA